MRCAVPAAPPLGLRSSTDAEFDETFRDAACCSAPGTRIFNRPARRHKCRLTLFLAYDVLVLFRLTRGVFRRRASRRIRPPSHPHAFSARGARRAAAERWLEPTKRRLFDIVNDC